MIRRFAVLSLIVTPVFAQPLTIVNVSAPEVNYVFDASGTVIVQDFSSKIGSKGFLQSRHFRGTKGAPASGMNIYEYRVDLRNATGNDITSLTVDIGPHVQLDFDGDQKLDDVFVITKGGMGTIALASAVRTGNAIEFTFTSPVKRTSSFFFGIVSKYPRKEVTATAANNFGAPLSLKAWAPAY